MYENKMEVNNDMSCSGCVPDNDNFVRILEESNKMAEEVLNIVKNINSILFNQNDKEPENPIILSFSDALIYQRITLKNVLKELYTACERIGVQGR